MKTYRILITLPGSARCLYFALATDSCSAIVAAMTQYPDACRISAKRMTA